MSNICLQFGQCGNQVGFKFLDTIYRTEVEDKDKWFRSTRRGDVARSILVDTESKVIQELLSDKSQWAYEGHNAVFKSGGSGNNWALGYNENGPALAESVNEKLRLECEQADYIKSVTTFLSAGGGTGSGVGSYIIEQLPDVFPNKYIISNLTVPFSSGASPVHLYNTIFSLSHLLTSSSALIMFYNDFLFKQCSQLYKDSEFKFVEMNNIISKQLCTLFHSYNENSFVPHCLPKLIPVQGYKLLSLKCFPYVKDIQTSYAYDPHIPWKSLIDRLKSLILTTSEGFWDNQNVTKKFSESKQKSASYYRALGNLVICRGKGSGNAKNCANLAFNTDSLYSELNPESDRFTYLFDNNPIFGQQQFSCIATNSAIFNYKLENIVGDAWNALMKNAYVHHYEKYGVSEKDFSASFLKVENLIKTYKTL